MEARRNAIFRAALATVLFADIVHLWAYLQVFPGLTAMMTIGRVIFVVWIAGLLCMATGFKAKASTAVNYLCCCLMLGLLAPAKGFDQTAGDSIEISLALLALLFAMLPRLKPSIVLPLYLSAVYVDTGIHKLLSPMWRAGLGVTTPMLLPSLVWVQSGWLAWFPGPLLRLTGWSVIAFELFFPLMYAWRRTRLMALISGMALHLAIMIVYPIPIFSGVMLVPYVALLPVDRSSVKSWFPCARQRKVAALVVVMYLAAVANFYLAKGVPSPVPQFMLRAARKTTFVLSGILGHGVFADGLFGRYDYQLRLVYSGQVEPYARGNLLALGVRDRAWENWWKKTQGPWVAIPQAEVNLETWAHAYWPGAARVEVEARRQFVNMHSPDTSLFSQNNAVPWRHVATIRENKISWDQTPSNDRDLGSYMNKILR